MTVVDVGGTLEREREQVRSRLAATPPAEWDAADLGLVAQPPVPGRSRELPEKRTYGSDFPFRDVGQRRPLDATDGIHESVVSGAYGGFSNIWGAQVMPFPAAAFRAWPVAAAEMQPHYESVLRAIPFAAEHDDLAELFPLHAPAEPLPALAERSEAVLRRYGAHRDTLRRRGVVVGRARLALKASDCTLAGLCMSGCPYSLIYSAAHTIDALRRSNRVDYHGHQLAIRVEEDEGAAVVTTRDLAGGGLRRFSADRVLLACGAIGTSRLVLGSLNLFDVDVRVLESRQFVLPFVSRRATPHDPRAVPHFTLNQFNMLVTLDENAVDAAQLHFYAYDPAFLDALPQIEWAREHLLRRVCVALGYLPSWASPSFALRVSPPADGALPRMTLHGTTAPGPGSRILRRVVRKIAASAPALDLWPVLPLMRLSAAGKSYHWGGTFPHVHEAGGRRFASDVVGRVAPWRRIHLVDASVFPSIPATTFTLSVMANAHRIADAVVRGRT